MGKFISLYGRRFGNVSPGTANQQIYYNTGSGLSATTTQEAIDELVEQVQGIMIIVPATEWVEQSNGTYMNTVAVRGVTADNTLDVCLYNDGTLSDEMKLYYDESVIEINTIENGVEITAFEPCDSDFMLILKGVMHIDKNALVNYGEMKETCDNLVSQIQGIVFDVLASKWVEESDGTYTNSFKVEGLSSDNVVDVNLYNDGTVSDDIINYYDENIIQVKIENETITVVATRPCDDDFIITVNGLLNI